MTTNAIPTVALIKTKPIVKPTYVHELANVNTFVKVNEEALRLWFTQLCAYTDHGIAWEEFCAMQYDMECEAVAYRKAKRYEDECERRERDYDRQYDRDTGIARYGEI